jgi:hypothetical protein
VEGEGLGSIRILAAASIASLMTATCTERSQPAAERPRTDFDQVVRRRIFFGHQSVGMNLLDGVRGLAEQERAALRVVETTDPSALVPGTLAHSFVAENGDPERKIASFERALDSGVGNAADVALLKFCYVDIGPDTDAAALFAKYQGMVTRQRARHPGLAFVHVTVPLTTVQGGIKAMVKWMLDRPPYGHPENARREEFNALLRQSYQGREPIFDLARLESTAPDGRTETAVWKGRAVPALVSAYTDDGGHLNPEGRVRAARALVTVLGAASTGAATSSGGR